MSQWHLRRAPSGELMLERPESEAVAVTAVCCFPWSQPQGLISLRNAQGTEQVFVPRLEDVPPETRQLLQEELGVRNFIPEILAIDSIEEDQELFVWRVRTQAGARTFLTERRDSLRQLPGGGVLIRDVAKDILLIRNPKALDKKSLALIWVHLD